MKSKTKPTIGRIIVFVTEENSREAYNGAKKVPAMIVAVSENEEHENSEVNLTVFTDGPENTHRVDVPYSEDQEPNTWHWTSKSS